MSYFLPVILVSFIAWFLITRRGFDGFGGGGGDGSAPPDGAHGD